MEELAKKTAEKVLGSSAIWNGTKGDTFYFSDVSFQTGVVVTTENDVVTKVEPGWLNEPPQYIYTVNSPTVKGWWRGNVGGSTNGKAIPIQETQGKMWFSWTATSANSVRTIKVNLKEI